MKVLSFLFIIAAVFACNLSSRLRVDKIVTDGERIRDGQKTFRNQNGRYATLRELADADLVGDEVVDGRDAGFIIELDASSDRYTLSIYPDRADSTYNENDQEQLSLYCDETGVLRAGFDPKKGADNNSDEIHPKH
ncbi:MAG: hypothetical protein WBD16_00940 [Pyrinomonadaceae bacterium]